MKNFNPFLLAFLLALCCWFGCSKDDETPKINDLQVTVEVDPQDPLKVEVSPSSKIAKSYRVYFDYDNAPESFENVSPDQSAKHEYPETSQTYTIRVLALAQGYDDGKFTQKHEVRFTPGFLITDFEDANNGLVYEGRKETTIETVDNPDSSAANNSAKVGKISLKGEEFEAIMIYPTRHIDVTDTSQQILSFDFYQGLAADNPIMVRLSTNATDGSGGTISADGEVIDTPPGGGDPTGGGGDDPTGGGLPTVGTGSDTTSLNSFRRIESPKSEDVEVMFTASHQGWKRIRLNFAKDRRNSKNPDEPAQALLDSYDRILVFVGYKNFAKGDFYIDNLRLGVQGSAIPDTDSDGLLDNRDICPTEEGTLESNGCPAFNPDDLPAFPPGTGSGTLSKSLRASIIRLR